MKPILKRPRLVFRRALHRAIRLGWRAGKITAPEAYLLYDVVNGSKKGGRYYGRPDLLVEAERTARQELHIHDAESAETGDVDWAAWLDLLVEWLPLIIKVLLTLLAFAEPPPVEPSESSKIVTPPVDRG